MRNVIIIGSGGLASEIRSYINDINRISENKIYVKGFVDDSFQNFEVNKLKYKFQEPYLGNTDTFEVSINDFVILAFASIKSRVNFLGKMRGCHFLSLIHPSAIVADSSIIGEGSIIAPFCVIGPNVKIGKLNVFTSYSFVSHDCVVGDNNFFSTSGLSGNVEVGENNFFGIKATILPSIRIGSNNNLQAGMVIDKNVSNNETVYYRYKEKITIVREN